MTSSEVSVFLYISEDGALMQSEVSPTPLDRDSVESGILSVLRFQDGVFEVMNPAGDWSSLPTSVIRPSPEGEYHSFSLDRGPTDS